MRRSSFPGWWVVAGCFLVLMTTCGLGFYGLAVYLAAFSKERGWAVASISLATTVYFFVSGVSGVVVARLIKRYDARWVITGGAVIGGAALSMFGMIHSKWQLYIVYSVFAVGFSASSLVPVTTVVTRWFDARRSVALSVASTGLSMGGIVITPAAKWLLDTRGIATGAPILGAVFVIGIVPVTWLLILPSPARYGWRPDGGIHSAGDAPVSTGVSVGEALRSRFFVYISIGYILALGSQVGAIQQLVKLAEERTDASTAAFATLVLAFVSVIARLIGGWLAEVFPMTRLTAVVAVVQGVSLVWLAFANQRTNLFLAIALFGATIGNLLMLQPLLLASRFGVRDYAGIYSRATLLMIVGNAGGPFLLGWLHDSTGNYRTAYMVAGMLSALGAVFIAAAGPAEQTAPYGAHAAPVAG